MELRILQAAYPDPESIKELHMEISINNGSAQITEPVVVNKTVALSSLNILEGGSISAPEGSQLTLTVNGMEYPIMSGSYQGNVVLTVTRDLPEIVDEYGDEKYRTALYVDEEGVDEDRSVLSAIRGGSYEGGNARDINIRSRGEAFNGLLYKAGEHDAENVKIDFCGNGFNDFAGVGAGIVATGTSKVHVRNADIHTKGVARGAVLAADHGEILIENSRIHAEGDDSFVPPEGHPLAKNMKEVPWVLGLYGTNRATNIVGSGTATYVNCDLQSEGWGVLSTDGVDDPEYFGDVRVHMNVKNSRIAITGESGYGSYSIGATHNTYDHTDFSVPSYALVCANEYAGASFINGTRVRSRRFGIMWHQNQGGVMEITDSVFDTDMATFLIKGCYPDIRVKNSELRAHNGIILQLMDSDDPGLGPTETVAEDKAAVKDPSHLVSEPNYADIRMFRFDVKHYCTDLQASFEHVSLEGDFYNATSNACRVGMIIPEGGMPKPGSQDEGAEKPEEISPMPCSTESPINLVLTFRDSRINGKVTAATAKHLESHISTKNREMLGLIENTPSPVVNNGVIVRFEGSCRWNVTGTCYLSALSFGPETEIAAAGCGRLVMYVDGKKTALVPGDYKGSITLQVE